MRYKNLIRKVCVIVLLVALTLCFYACSKNDKPNSEPVSSSTQSENETKMVFATRATKAVSGNCGEAATWTYETGSQTLTIKGTGQVNDNVSMNQWAGYAEKIVIEEGITGFYGGIFNDFINIKEIDLPNTPMEISEEDFSETAYYKDSNNWDNGVLYIDNHLVKALETTNGKYTVKNGTIAICFRAFWGSEISEIVLPDSVVKIGNEALTKCYSLKSIYIGSGLQDFSGSVFEEGTEIEFYTGPYLLEKIEVSKHNNFLSSENGVLYNKDKTELLWYPASSSAKELSMPDTVQTISWLAFINAANLETLILGDNVTAPDFLLYGCNSLKKVYVGKSLQYDDEIGWIFNNCPSLEFIDVHMQNPNYSSVEGVLFNKNKTTLVKYPAAKKGVEYNIPDNVTTIANYAITKVIYLEKLFIGKNVTNLAPSCIGYFDDDWSSSGMVLYKIYYEGTSNQWESISSDLYSEPIVYYNSEKFTETKSPEVLTTKKSNMFDWF